MRRSLARSLPFCLLALMGALLLSSGALARGRAPHAAGQGTTYVANYNGSTVTEYAGGASGDVGPVATIEGGQTGLDGPGGLTLSPGGRLFVANYSNSTVTEYADGASGNAAPVATIKGGATGLDGPEGIALDDDGHLFVANYSNSTVTEYADGASGNAAPIATITGPHTSLSSPAGLTFDPATREIVVTNTKLDSVTRYRDGDTGDVAPVSILKGGADNGLIYPAGVVLDAAGRMFVSSAASGTINEYAKGASGNDQPIAHSDDSFNNPQGLALTPQGDVLIAERPGNGSGSVSTWHPGNPSAGNRIKGYHTGLDGPIDVAVLPPVAAPGAPSIGRATAGDGVAKLTFTAPGYDGGAPVTSYTVTARDLTDASRGGQTASGQGSPITVNGLVNGDSYTLTVTARNTAGTGRASAPSNAVVPRPHVFAVTVGNRINQYGSANNTPLSTITGPQTGLAFASGMAIDASGNLYVANRTPGTVTEYAAGASGNASPIAKIGGLNLPQAVAIGPDGHVFAANRGGGVDEFARNGSEAFTKVAGLNANNPGLNYPDGLAVDVAGHLFVANYYGNSVVEYAKGAHGGDAPIAKIAGSATGLDYPEGVAVDAAGHLFVANYQGNTITEYATGANGNVAPIAKIAGSVTGLNGPAGIALDHSGGLVVANATGDSVTLYRRGANGNVAPYATISGGDAQVGGATGVAVAPGSGVESGSPPPSTAPSNHFRIARIRSSHGGAITFRVVVPGRGRVVSVATASGHACGSRRFVYGRRLARVSRRGAVAVTLTPNRRGRRLLRNHRGPFAVRLTIAYTPRGGSRRVEGPYRVLISRARTLPGRG
jgi:6-phosphogluconolactonase (cycloisomerase 2 family)